MAFDPGETPRGSTAVTEDELRLMLGDRVNFPYLLARGILNFMESITRTELEISDLEIREAAATLKAMVPNSWRDPEFKKGLEAAAEKVQIDARPMWCGVRVGPLEMTERPRDNPMAVFHVVIDLLDRRGLLSKRNYQEISPGEKLEDLEKLQEAENPQEEQPQENEPDNPEPEAPASQNL